MANKDKFIDRSPIICPAGLPSPAPIDTVKTCLLEYKLQEAVDSLKRSFVGDDEERRETFDRPQRVKNFRNLGIHDEIRHSLRPPHKTRYQTLINDLKETPYASFWNREDGRSKNAVGNLPIDHLLAPEAKTYGRPTIRETSMSDLLKSPPDCREGPGKQSNRNYERPSFDPDKRYGSKTGYDPYSTRLACLSRWYLNDPIFTLTARQADYARRTSNGLGKVLEPNNNIASVPEGHRFGRRLERPRFDLKESLKQPPYSRDERDFERDLHEWMNHLNRIRRYVKEMRKNRFDFHVEDLHQRLLYEDKEKSGLIASETFYCLCFAHGISLAPRQTFDELLGYLRLTDGRRLMYDRALDLLDVNKEMPSIERMREWSETNCATMMANGNDAETPDNCLMPTAGTSRISASDETKAGQLIYPSVYTNYGLRYRDFFKPRSKETIKNLFEKAGYRFSDDVREENVPNFEELWTVAEENDRTNGAVCVDTFYKLLQGNCRE